MFCTALICLAPAWLHSHEGLQLARSDPYRNSKIQALNKNTHRNFEVEIAGENQWEPAQPLNGIDDFTFRKMANDGVPINATTDDANFLRRTALLLTGRLPEPETTRRFLANESPGKRAALVDEIIGSEAFETHWSFWFQEYFKSTGQLLRIGQPLYNEYFKQMVRENKPLDVMAVELMTATGLTDEVAAANFFARAGEGARLSQDFQDNIAVHAVDRFLGVPLACISCHDGAYHLEDINLYLADRKREDLWGMAAFFSELRLRPGTRMDNLVLSANITRVSSRGYNAETDRGDRPTRAGGLIQPKYIFNDAVTVQSDDNLTAFANNIVNDRQFARNWANRFWGHVFGLALVEPMDGFDLYRIDPKRELPEGWESQVLDSDLLEYMTDRMIDFNFNFREYLKLILNSATYQMSSNFHPGNWQDSHAPYYTRFLARRLSAESVYDNLVVATGVKTTLSQATRDGRVNVTYAHELRDLNQPNRQEDIAVFLDLFGRGDRYQTPRTNAGNISQALALMNSTVISNRLLASENRINNYLRQGLGAAEIVNELYLDFLCRPPSEEETEAMLAELENYEDLREKASTVQWLLINKLQFNFIF